MSDTKYSLNELREFAMSINIDMEIDRGYVEKYNVKRKDMPGGRAWVMWFIDLFEREYVRLDKKK